MAHLQVFITYSCSVCVHSRTLAAEIAERYPDADIEIIDVGALNEDELPEAVFATPTWLWDGRLYSLGNPDPARLWQQLAESI